MTTTNTISAEGRKRVAEAVLRKPCRLVGDYIAACGPRPDQYHYRWDPNYKITQKYALLTTAAQLIDALQVDPVKFSYNRKLDYKNRFIAAIAANDVNAIEALVLQLLEGKE